MDENDRIRQLEIAERKKQEESDIVNTLPDEIHVPVTLRSIGTTIWSLGELNTGIGRSRSWSNRGVRQQPHQYELTFSRLCVLV